MNIGIISSTLVGVLLGAIVMKLLEKRIPSLMANTIGICIAMSVSYPFYRYINEESNSSFAWQHVTFISGLLAIGILLTLLERVRKARKQTNSEPRN